MYYDSYFIEVEMNVLNLPMITQEGGIAEASILAEFKPLARRLLNSLK